MSLRTTLEHELADLAAVARLVIDGVVEMFGCPLPKTHAARMAPYWSAAGELRCSICDQRREEETEMESCEICERRPLCRVIYVGDRVLRVCARCAATFRRDPGALLAAVAAAYGEDDEDE